MLWSRPPLPIWLHRAKNHTKVAFFATYLLHFKSYHFIPLSFQSMFSLNSLSFRIDLLLSSLLSPFVNLTINIAKRRFKLASRPRVRLHLVIAVSYDVTNRLSIL